MSTAHDAHHDDHGHGHHGSRFIQHHYDDAQHQFDSGKLGIWLFLAQEVLFFSALFVAYILYRVHHSELYHYAHKWLDVKYGAINTAILIFSSLTAAWAVRCAQLNQRRGLILCIAVTIACAFGFLGIKYIEYSHKYHEQILFGRYFDPCVTPGENPMITKSNECPGHVGSVVFDRKANKPTAGCTESSTIDLDPDQPDVQAECEVFEVKVAHTKDAKVNVVEKELSRRPIPLQCEPMEFGEHEVPGAKPCWKLSYQPAVCPDLTDAEARLQGKAAKPQVGMLIVYGDHEHRHGVKVEYKCKAAPVSTAPADPLAEHTQQAQLGKGTIVHGKAPHHEDHNAIYMGPPPEHTNMFFTIYFAMTGLHGIHVLAGIIVFMWLLVRALKGHFTPDYFGPVDYAALYWHIVDLIWIFLFPLLYLIV